MALRNRIPDAEAKYDDPIRGVNLVASPEDLEPGEARLLSNCYFWNGVRTREGSTRLNSGSLGVFRVLGGTKFYYGVSNSKRIIAFSDRISQISDGGTETLISTVPTANQETYFTTWSITDKVYITNQTDKLYEYDGTTFQSVDSLGGAVAVPNACRRVTPVLDRLLAITSGGVIERTNARVAHIWSNGSSWATFRPSLVGPFTGLHPHTLRSTGGDLFPGAIACQANAMYMITGTNYGSDVTAASAPTGEDSAIKLIDPRVGTSSPNSLATVPGVGLFGISSDLNVWFLPFGSASPIILGDKIRSTDTTTTIGLESANVTQLDKIWMTYYDRKLIMGFPIGSDNFCSRYFWMDMRAFVERNDLGPVWNGPHYGFYTNHAWTEEQNGEKSLVAGEGNSSNGVFVYRLLQPNTFTDAVGTSDNNITFDYWSYYKDFGAASQEKYVQAIQMDMNNYLGSPTLSLYDLTGLIAGNLPIARLT